MRMCVICKSRYEKGTSITYHKFPSASMKQLWLQNLKNYNLTPKANDHLCSKHFTDDCFLKYAARTILKKGSVPTIFPDSTLALTVADQPLKEEYSSDLGDSTSRDNMVTPIPYVSGIETDSKRELCSINIDQKNINLEEPSTSGTQTKIRAIYEDCENIKHDHRYQNSQKTPNKTLQRVERSLKMSRARVKVLSQHVKRLKKHVSCLKDIIIDLKKKKKVEDSCANMSDQFNDFQPLLFKRVLKNSSKNMSRGKYPPSLRSFAINLYFYSPKAYNYVRKQLDFALPHPDVIRSWYRSFGANPGFMTERRIVF